MDDERNLICRAQSGDVEAFEALVAPYHNALYRIALSTTGDPDDAQDTLQEALVSAFRNIASYRREASLSTWLPPNCPELARNWLRHSLASPSQARRPYRHPLSAGVARPVRNSLGRDRQRAVTVALAKLPDAYRETVVLRYYSDCHTSRSLHTAHTRRHSPISPRSRTKALA